MNFDEKVINRVSEKTISSSDHKRENSDAAAYSARVRRIIGELYSQHLDILLFLTLAFYVLVTLKDAISQPPMVGVLYAVDALVIVLLLCIYVLERRGIVNTDNVFLTPIPVAVAMLINGYTHIIILEDSEMLVRGILMTIAFGIVSLLPWIFWLLNSLSVAMYVGHVFGSWMSLPP